jgi:hypothetical protein
MIGEKQEIVDVVGREYLGLFTRHLASYQLFKSILDQLSLTATETFVPNALYRFGTKPYQSAD